MTKTIDTLVNDIYEVIQTRGGWDETITNFMAEGVRKIFQTRLEEEEAERSGALRMSAIGTTCKRKLWYRHNHTNSGESFSAPTRLKFLYGDILEQLLLSLVIASGHDVRGMQDELEIVGIKGHRDAVIDGITVDVKSASPYSFKKFKEGLTTEADSFGYLSQLGSYVKAGHASDPSVHPTKGCFLAIDKVSGEITLDEHEFTQSLEEYEVMFLNTIDVVNGSEEPERAYKPKADGYQNKKTDSFVPNGNKYLDVQCSYCEFKTTCWPTLRTFMYKDHNGYRPKFYTHIEKEPRAIEVAK